MIIINARDIILAVALVAAEACILFAFVSCSVVRSSTGYERSGSGPTSNDLRVSVGRNTLNEDYVMASGSRYSAEEQNEIESFRRAMQAAVIAYGFYTAKAIYEDAIAGEVIKDNNNTAVQLSDSGNVVPLEQESTKRFKAFLESKAP